MEPVIGDFVTNDILLKDFIDVHSFSNIPSAESLGGAYRAEAKDPWTASSGITENSTHSLTCQLRGSSMRSSSMTELEAENVDQH